MTPRPIHRWKTFWIGILILTFLSWAWVHSRTHDDLVRFHPGTRMAHSLTNGRQTPWYVLRSAGGSIWWETKRDSFGATTSPRFEFLSTTSSKTVLFPPPYSHYATTLLVRGGDYSFSYTRIAYWLIMFLFSISWAYLLIRRSIRMKKHHEANTPSASENNPHQISP